MAYTALITGASSGIGQELAKIHASKGGNLVLVARNKIKLDKLKSELVEKYRISVSIMVMDLSVEGSAQKIYDQTTLEKIQIDCLINNAGFGDFGFFSLTDTEKQVNMINLNIIALTLLTKLYLKDMLDRKGGRIMNVASIAAFQPGPKMAVYSATKAYVLSFSQAVGNEVRHQGVTITALCPGATESGFQEAASMQHSKMFNKAKLPSSKEVAEYGYDAMIKGRSVAIPGFLNNIMADAVGFIPRNWVLKLVRKIQDAA
ncbi:SDR family NAD(P)-dependent oxidoreductase [Dyadobacter frigoris]|uniref:NADP-dependent 3-hydroxy acid dehydrogenase YdfG n=1 Tax=Dyadobacter frigoris TaxID=2576211 RepID=A0A4U6CRZ1_9BACT|nr:SDR family oxidoreductase [Dyadobacter frigoris]TKT86257.1 SDR family oxidoreductase [Dyadobacter frigoris]GLU56902.1 short-chain dehydrogenase [Dyadobacter frigoris]